MTDILDQTWRIDDDAVANKVGEETVILHMTSGIYFGLDEIGTLLWEGLKSGATPAAVCNAIVEEYDIERATVESDLRTFLAELAENQLISHA
ncbi:PqqD family protein [Erythrobacter sp. JK5]|uniref:PqqD family protein n=1 Tax=Erythrobacter sp. JK5 TaxID=2829500 RepID=UPI001BAC40EF|nr:PqqD family protein [Erythrobacter sp. JK5]QUL37653.1 PqqD family protein [Erythrobacter sp. JK5]